MTRTTTRRLAPALVALALLAGCSGESTQESASPTPSQSADAALCAGYDELQKAVEDLKSTPLDTTGTPEEIQAAAAALEPKVATVKADLNRLSAISDGPVAAAIGEMNQKADDLRESLAQAKAEAQEEMGPKITEAQTQLNAAYTELTTTLDAVCPSS